VQDPGELDPIAQDSIAQDPAEQDPTEQDPGEQDPGEQDPGEQDTGAEDPEAPADESYAQLREEHDEIIAEYFAICDHDGDGFVTLAEAQESLELDRDAFARYDGALGPEGRDGRITLEEFASRYLDTLARLGAFRPPVPPSEGVVPPLRTPEQLRIAYDSNSNGALDLSEVARALEDYQVTGVAPGAALAALDADRDGRLVSSELGGLELMIEDAVKTLPWIPEEESAENILELFGELTPRPRTPGAAAGPPVIAGPLPHFHRLDVDRDETIGLDDLLHLQSPARLSIRPEALLADLDRDGDAELSLEEFRRALGEPEIER
jgi:Ca2+-binding EF-hand superfamily protein